MAVQPSVSEVLARAESAPVTPELVAELWAIEVAGLSEDEAVGYAVAMDRVANAAHARRGLAVNRVFLTCPDSKDSPRELRASGQLGAALGLGSGGADELVLTSGQLADMLPATQALALAGDLPWRKAAIIATHTIGMTAEQAARVEAKVLGKAWERSPASHEAAVRRARDQVDPDRTDRDRKDRERDIRMARQHLGAGMGELFVHMRSEDIDLSWTAADAFARRLKAAGDPRSLDELRAEFWPHCARSYLSHCDPAYCDTVCDPLPPERESAPGAALASPRRERSDREDLATDAGRRLSDPPTRHGRPVVQHVAWELTSLLGLTEHCGELRDSSTLLPPSAMRDLVAGGGRIRRMIIDPNTGEQLDLTPISWRLPATDGRKHGAPVVLTLVTTGRFADLPAEVRDAVETCVLRDPKLGDKLRQLLDYPLTAGDLDNRPDDETPSASLAEFTASRAGHPVNPAAGPTAASAADLEHHEARSDGGQTVRMNLGPIVRRWHRLKTFADWTVHQVTRGWLWTSPTGRKYTIEPHDYRLGP